MRNGDPGCGRGKTHTGPWWYRKNIRHTVHTGGFLSYKLRCTDGAAHKGISGMCLMGYLYAFPQTPKDDCMVTYDVPASDCVHTNLIYRPLTRNPMSAVDNVLI